MRTIVLLLLLSAAVWPMGTVVGKDFTVLTRAGESLYDVSRRYGLAIEHLAFANRRPLELAVAPKTRLLVPARRIVPANPPSDGVVVNLPERGAYLFRAGHFVKFFPIAIGSPATPTPIGHFKIAYMTKDPSWLPPAAMGLGEKVVPPGPDNPLGDRWIGLSVPGVGFHGTTAPLSIGADASHGCMRMWEPRVHELYDQVRVGMPVWIEYDTFRLGRNRQTGQTFMVVFPDVYRHGNMQAKAWRLLREAHAQVDRAAVERVLKQATGVAVPLLTLGPPSPQARKPSTSSPPSSRRAARLHWIARRAPS